MDDLDLENTVPDWDPEGDSEYQLNTTKEHYVAVGKSRLRDVELDLPKYKGRKISRKELERMEESFGDSDSDSGSEDDFGSDAFEGHSDVSDEEFGQSDAQEDFQGHLDNSEYEEEGSNASNVSNDDVGENNVQDESEVFNSEDVDPKTRLLKKLKQYEKEEEQIASKLTESAQNEAEQGSFVRSQLGLWEGLLEIRIKMQKVIDCANVLPQYDYYVDYFEQHKDEELETELEDTSRELCGVIDELIELRKVFYV